jgi:Protein of unknown function (DUF1761)
MHTTLDHVSILAIVAATIAVMALGALWFTLVFERPYAVVLGRGSQPKAKMAPLYFVGPSLCVLVTTVASAILMSAQRIGSIGEAIGFGTIVGVGYLSATAMNMAINPNIPRPILYGLLSSAYFLVSSILISVIIYVIH